MKWETVPAGSNRVSSNAVDIATRSCNAHGINFERNSKKRKHMKGQQLATAVPFLPDTFSDPSLISTVHGNPSIRASPILHRRANILISSAIRSFLASL